MLRDDERRVRGVDGRVRRRGSGSVALRGPIAGRLRQAQLGAEALALHLGQRPHDAVHGQGRLHLHEVRVEGVRVAAQALKHVVVASRRRYQYCIA